MGVVLIQHKARGDSPVYSSKRTGRWVSCSLPARRGGCCPPSAALASWGNRVRGVSTQQWVVLQDPLHTRSRAGLLSGVEQTKADHRPSIFRYRGYRRP